MFYLTTRSTHFILKMSITSFKDIFKGGNKSVSTGTSSISDLEKMSSRKKKKKNYDYMASGIS